LGFNFVRNLYHDLITIIFPASNKSNAKSDQFILLVHRRSVSKMTSKSGVLKKGAFYNLHDNNQ